MSNGNSQEPTPEYKFMVYAGLAICGAVLLLIGAWAVIPAQPGIW